MTYLLFRIRRGNNGIFRRRKTENGSSIFRIKGFNVEEVSVSGMFPIQLANVTSGHLLLHVLYWRTTGDKEDRVRNFTNVEVRLRLCNLLTAAVSVSKDSTIGIFRIKPCLFLRWIAGPIHAAQSARLRQRRTANGRQGVSLLCLCYGTFKGEENSFIGLLLRLRNDGFRISV